MAEGAGVDELYLSSARPRGPLPAVSESLQRLVEAHGPIDPVVVRPHGAVYEILTNVEIWLAAKHSPQPRHKEIPVRSGLRLVWLIEQSTTGLKPNVDGIALRV